MKVLLEWAATVYLTHVKSVSGWVVVLFMNLIDYTMTNKSEFLAESCAPFVGHWFADTMDVKVVCKFDNSSPLFRSLSLDSFLGIVHVDYRSQSDESINFIVHLSVIFGKGREHLGSAHWVTHVRNLVKACEFSNVVNTGCEIVLTKFIEAIIVVLLHVWVLIWVEGSMAPGINVSSVITKPYIIASLG